MKRRSFFRRAGIVIAGSVATAGSEAGAAQHEAVDRRGSTETRRVLITSAASSLSGAIAEKLRESWRIRMTAPAEVEAPYPFAMSDLQHGKSTAALVEDVDAIVHVAIPPSETSGGELIDFRTRATYNLLRAAAEQGVRRVIYLSSLAIMLGCDDRFAVNEDFRPRPTPEPEMLSHYLGEFTCREFARSGKFDVAVLRLGRMSQPGGPRPSLEELPRMKPQDAAAAVASAVGNRNGGAPRELGRWNVFHVHSEPQSTRFPLTKAERLLQYRPKPTGEAP